jgi:hypothetical protein
MFRIHRLPHPRKNLESDDIGVKQRVAREIAGLGNRQERWNNHGADVSDGGRVVIIKIKRVCRRTID